MIKLITSGGVYGLSLEKTSLIDWYEATIEALAYESKFILEELKYAIFYLYIL